MNKNQSPERETRTFNMPVEIRAEGDSRIVSGYAVKFNQLSQNLGWFREKIDSQAFADANMDDVVALFNHDYNFILARTISGTLKLEVDETGLRYEFEAPNTSAGNDLVEMLKRGDVQHSSFGFTIESSEW
jgi:HK97 family phage prohead protease